MKIRDHASQFTTLILSLDPVWGTEAKTAISRAGYDVYVVTSRDDLSLRLKEKSPHVLVFSLMELTGQLSRFVEETLQVHPEIKFLVVGESSQFSELADYDAYGFEQFVSFQKDNLGSRIVSGLDRICEKLYLTYQNEQLYAKLKQGPASGPMSIPTLASATIPNLHVSQRLMAYQSASSREAMIQKFFEFAQISQVVYFRFLPTVVSFVATQAIGFETKTFQGVGCQIEGLSVRDLSTQLSLGVVPAPILGICHGTFKIQNPRLQPLHSHQQLEGIFVYSNDLSEEIKNRFFEEYSLFSLSFSYFDLQKKLERLDLQDPVTDLFNRKYYDSKIIEEVERALRIRQAVSVVKLALDDFFEIEQTMGESSRDLLLKKVSQILQKSSRTNDIVARTGQNEFSMILPHCHRQGALVRTERIRRSIENGLTLESGMKVSVSAGISEYPSLCKSAAHLEESAIKSLRHIASRGGNKICVYKAPADHAPDFQVAIEQG